MSCTIAIESWQISLVTDWHELMRSNFQWEPDIDVWGKREFWERPKVIDGKWVGDCDDIVIEGMHWLHEQGIDANALSIASCFVPQPAMPTPVPANNRNHVVLLVRDKDGLIVSDCNLPFAERMENLPDHINWSWPVAGISGEWTEINYSEGGK